MFNYKSLIGVNTVHMDVKTIHAMGFSRFEICMGRGMPYEERLLQMQDEMALAEQLGLKYSVHHPIYLLEEYPYDYLDAFFLDPDEEKRRLSLCLLEENLKALECRAVDYLVIHFSGVYPEPYMEKDDFQKMLDEMLHKIDQLAAAYDRLILLEYFGSNAMFALPQQWISELAKYQHLSILTDTGHLYFASLQRGFDYEQALEALAGRSKAFHLWTTQGQTAYGENDYYKKYHHVMATLHQHKEDGWAFNTQKSLEVMLEHQQPIILEASPAYGGKDYFMGGIEAICDHASNYQASASKTTAADR